MDDLLELLDDDIESGSSQLPELSIPLLSNDQDDDDDDDDDRDDDDQDDNDDDDDDRGKFNKFRTIDGSGNNPSDLGAAGTELIRLFDPAYEDGVDEPRGGDFNASTLPNPRTISNTISNQTESVPNFLNASDWLWQWGQFIDHDLGLNEANDENPPGSGDFTPIPVPQDDLSDPFVQNGITNLPFIRVPAAPGTGTGPGNPRQQINQITSFIDASSVYGSDDERAEFLRTFEKGQLKTTVGDNGEILLPFNTEGLPNATGGTNLPPEEQYIAGDIRVNEQLGLNAVHTLFVREHNRLAEEIHERFEAGEDNLVEKFEDFEEHFREENPGATPGEIKDEFLYETARKVVGAQVQIITYNEFLPLLIGDTLLDDYDGYQTTIDPSVSNEFANAAYRLGHTLLSDQLRRINAEGITETPLADAFFNPADVTANGVDSVLQGLIFQEAQEADNLVVDGVRNFLFEAGTGGLDLAAVNIGRGRDVGLPGYVEVYNELFPYDTITDFDDLPFAPGVVDLFEEAYSDVGEIDLWIGGISELPADHGGLLGPTFSFFIQDQFTRARDGDRFFFLEEDQQEHLEILDPDILDTTLSDVIRRNTEHSFLVPDNAFEVPFDNEVPGGDENDNVLNGTNLRDLIEGNGGDDTIRGRGGDDILLGEDGNDTLRGNRGEDTLLGGGGDDTLRGGRNDDILVGGGGKDDLRGGNGDDKLKGVGNVIIDGVGEIDVYTGGGGRDTFILGKEGSVFYAGAEDDDFAQITDFRSQRDTAELAGDEDDYVLAAVTGGALPQGTGLYLDDGSGDLSSGDDLIAVIENQTITEFGDAFVFLG
ncbi:MAG: peroxidase family protein [Xenococcaceae cyanobacterium]